MRGVAEEHDAIAAPAVEGNEVVHVRAQDVGRCGRVEQQVHGLGKCREHRAELVGVFHRSAGFAGGRVGGDEPIDFAWRDRGISKTTVRRPDLTRRPGEFRRKIERGDGAVRGLSRIAQRVSRCNKLADRGALAVGADDEIEHDGAAIGETHNGPSVLDEDTLASSAEVHATDGNLRQKDFVKPPAVDGDRRLTEATMCVGEIYGLQQATARVVNFRALEGQPGRDDLLRDPEPPQHLHCVGRHHEPRAGRANGRRGFVDVGIDAALAQRDRRGEAANSGPDHCDI